MTFLLQASEWPLESFCDQLVTDLFSPRWESRHGAATALREVIACHGLGAGKTANTTKQQVFYDSSSSTFFQANDILLMYTAVGIGLITRK